MSYTTSCTPFVRTVTSAPAASIVGRSAGGTGQARTAMSS